MHFPLVSLWQPEQDDKPAEDPTDGRRKEGYGHTHRLFSAVKHNTGDVGDVSGPNVTKMQRKGGDLPYVMKNMASAALEPGERPAEASGETFPGGEGEAAHR